MDIFACSYVVKNENDLFSACACICSLTRKMIKLSHLFFSLLEYVRKQRKIIEFKRRTILVRQGNGMCIDLRLPSNRRAKPVIINSEKKERKSKIEV